MAGCRRGRPLIDSISHTIRFFKPMERMGAGMERYMFSGALTDEGRMVYNKER